MTLVLLGLAIIPSLAISYWIYKQDKYEKEPPAILLVCFLWGCISTIPAFLGQFYFKETEDPNSLLITFLFSFFVISVTEELSKFFFLRFYAYPKDDFNEPMDGIVYAVMVGMGFATLENLLYVFGNQGGFSTALGRAVTAVPAHAAFAIMMGAYVGLAKFIPQKRDKFMFRGILLAVSFHGLYDFFLLQKSFEGLAILSVIALSIAITLARQLIRFNQEISPFKNKKELADSTPSVSDTQQEQRTDISSLKQNEEV